MSGKSKRRRTKSAYAAQSSKTGLLHVFLDVKEWERLIKHFDSRKRNNGQTELLEAIAFWNWISEQEPLSIQPTVELVGPLYRLCPSVRDPLSITGSFGCGGRFNIGAAQVRKELAEIRPFGCIYLASSKQCAEAEAPRPLGKLLMHEISLRRTFKLWDMGEVIAHYKKPGLEDLVKKAPVDALWEYRKSPSVSQLISNFLRNIGGDGIAFPSTKDPSGINYALFFDSDTDCKMATSAVALNKQR